MTRKDSTGSGRVCGTKADTLDPHPEPDFTIGLIADWDDQPGLVLAGGPVC